MRKFSLTSYRRACMLGDRARREPAVMVACSCPHAMEAVPSVTSEKANICPLNISPAAGVSLLNRRYNSLLCV